MKKYIILKTLLFSITFLTAHNLHADTDPNSQGDLGASGPQAKLAENAAPIVVLPLCDPRSDYICPVDSYQPGDFNLQKQADPKAIEQVEGKIAAGKIPPTLNWAYDELKGFVRISYLFFRIYNPVRGAPYDGNSVALIYKKTTEGSSFSNPQSLQNLKFVGSIANTLGVAVMSAGEAQFVDAILPNFEEGMSKKLSRAKFKLLLQPREVQDAYAQSVETMTEQINAHSRLADLQLDNRVIIYSTPRAHSLLTVNDLGALTKKITAKNLVVLVPPAALTRKVVTDFFDKTFAGEKITIADYKLVNFVPILRAHKDEMFAKNAKDPAIPAGQPVNDAAGNPLQLISMGSEFKNSAGEASGANAFPGWPLPVVVGADGKTPVTAKS